MNAISSNYNNMSVNWYYSMINSSNAASRLAAATNTSQTQSGDSVQISPKVLAFSRMSQSSPVEDLSSILDQMVTDGTITQDQEDAIKKALEEGMAANQPGTQTGNTTQPADPLDDLVESGVISTEQQAAVKAAFESVMGPPPAAPSQSTSGDQVDPLASLVESGVLTQDQAEAVKSALQSMGPQKMQGPPPGPPPTEAASDESDISSFIDEILASLVEDGTISDDQEEEINSTLESLLAATETDESDSDENVLDSLVSSGVISQNQESAVVRAFEEAIRMYAMSSNNLNW